MNTITELLESATQLLRRAEASQDRGDLAGLVVAKTNLATALYLTQTPSAGAGQEYDRVGESRRIAAEALDKAHTLHKRGVTAAETLLHTPDTSWFHLGGFADILNDLVDTGVAYALTDHTDKEVYYYPAKPTTVLPETLLHALETEYNATEDSVDFRQLTRAIYRTARPRPRELASVLHTLEELIKDGRINRVDGGAGLTIGFYMPVLDIPATTGQDTP